MNKNGFELKDIMTDAERDGLTKEELEYLDSMKGLMHVAAGEYMKQKIRQVEYAKVKTANRHRNKVQRKARRQNRK